MRILVLEDSPERISCFEQNFLGKSEYAVTYVNNVADFLTSLESFYERGTPFDVVCMDHDLGLPLDGYDAAKQMFSLPRECFPKLAVIHTNNPRGAKDIGDTLFKYVDCWSIPYLVPGDWFPLFFSLLKYYFDLT